MDYKGVPVLGQYCSKIVATGAIIVNARGPCIGKVLSMCAGNHCLLYRLRGKPRGVLAPYYVVLAKIFYMWISVKCDKLFLDQCVTFAREILKLNIQSIILYYFKVELFQQYFTLLLISGNIYISIVTVQCRPIYIEF